MLAGYYTGYRTRSKTETSKGGTERVAVPESPYSEASCQRYAYNLTQDQIDFVGSALKEYFTDTSRTRKLLFSPWDTLTPEFDSLTLLLGARRAVFDNFGEMNVVYRFGNVLPNAPLYGVIISVRAIPDSNDNLLVPRVAIATSIRFILEHYSDFIKIRKSVDGTSCLLNGIPFKVMSESDQEFEFWNQRYLYIDEKKLDWIDKFVVIKMYAEDY